MVENWMHIVQDTVYAPQTHFTKGWQWLASYVQNLQTTAFKLTF